MLKLTHKLILSGAIGRVQLMSEVVVAGQGLAGYKPLPLSHYPTGGPGGPGMSLIDHGIHLVDIFSWLLGERPCQVLGHGLRSGDPAGTEFLVTTYPSGAMGHLLYNNATFSAGLPNEGMFAGGAGWGNDGQYVAAGGWINDPGSISVWGTHGALRIFHYANALYLSDETGLRRVELAGTAPPRPFFGTARSLCLSHFGEPSAGRLCPGRAGRPIAGPFGHRRQRRDNHAHLS